MWCKGRKCRPFTGFNSFKTISLLRKKMFNLQHWNEIDQHSAMTPITNIRTFFEKQAFGVCTWLGDKLHMRSSVIRLFFIYASCLTVASPLIIYMILAFWLKMKSYVRAKRTSVWDL